MSRTDLKPAWNKREDAPKPKPKAAPQKKKGLVKTSVAVSPTKVVPASSMDDIEDILDAFSDEDASPAPSGEPSEAKAEERQSLQPTLLLAYRPPPMLSTWHQTHQQPPHNIQTKPFLRWRQLRIYQRLSDNRLR